MSSLLSESGIDHDVISRASHETIVSHLLLGGTVLVVEGPSDQIVFQYAMARLNRRDVVVVNVLGEAEVGDVVVKLRRVFKKGVAGVVDYSKTRAHCDRIHILHEKRLEKYYNRPVRNRKLEHAYKVVMKRDGYDFADEKAFLEEARQVLQLAEG